MLLHLDIAAAALCLGLLAAGTPADAAPPQMPVRDGGGVIRPIDEAYRAVREIREARRAIFDGAPGQAAMLVGEAKDDMQAVQRRARDLAMPVGNVAAAEDAYIPVDVLLVLAKGFKPTAQTRAPVEKANGYIAKGEYRLAIAVLNDAHIGVTVSATLLPANASLRSVEGAASLLGARKYYEASQVLKAVEDSFVTETYSTDGALSHQQ